MNATATLIDRNGRTIATLGNKDERWSDAAFSPDSNFVISRYAGELNSEALWDKEGKRVGDPVGLGDGASNRGAANGDKKAHTHSFKFTRDGKALVCLTVPTANSRSATWNQIRQMKSRALATISLF